MNRTIPDDPERIESLDRIPQHLSSAVDDLISHLDRSVMLRVRNIPRREYVSRRSLNSRSFTLRDRRTSSGQARVAVFFSGGIDSTVVAYLADRFVEVFPRHVSILSKGNRHVDPDEPIDLLNVAFENPRKITVKVEGNVHGLPKREKKQKLRDPLDYTTVKVTYDVPDRLTGLQEVEELRRLCPKRKWNFLEINVPYEGSPCSNS